MDFGTNFNTTALYLLLLLAVPVVTVLGLTVINRNSKDRLASRHGSRVVVWLGGLGVIIHELSHLLMALVFGHHIDDFRLLITDGPASGGALGYVSHSWKKGNYYQFIGNVLIGTAPVYGCTAVLILLTRWLVPNIYYWGLQRCGLLVGSLTNGPVSTSPTHWWGILIWALLSINITIGGFDLSSADLKNAFPAFLVLYLIIGIVLLVLVWLGKAALVGRMLMTAVVVFSMVMAIAIFWSVLVNLLVRLF